MASVSTNCVHAHLHARGECPGNVVHYIPSEPTGKTGQTKKRPLPWTAAQLYPQLDSNQRTRLRRPALYPLSYGGSIRWQFTTEPRPVQTTLSRRDRFRLAGTTRVTGVRRSRTPAGEAWALFARYTKTDYNRGRRPMAGMSVPGDWHKCSAGFSLGRLVKTERYTT